MAILITLQIDGVPEEFSSGEVATGGDNTHWVPDAETTGMSLQINANGTYNASKNGWYGYRWVGVSVTADSVTGKWTDGKTYAVTKANDGTLVWTEITE